jgi:hypothetical protein
MAHARFVGFLERMPLSNKEKLLRMFEGADLDRSVCEKVLIC